MRKAEQPVLNVTCSHCHRHWPRTCLHRRNGCWSREQSDRSIACVWPVKTSEGSEEPSLAWSFYHLIKSTYKLFRAGEVEELDEAEVIPCHQAEAGVRHTSAVNIRFLCVTRPNPKNFITQDAGKTGSRSITMCNVHILHASNVEAQTLHPVPGLLTAPPTGPRLGSPEERKWRRRSGS